MNLSHPRTRFVDSKTWDRFLKALQAQEVKQRYLQWYALRVEQYVDAHPEIPLDQHTAAEVTAYLREIDCSGRLNDWQFLQLVEALQVLCATVLAYPRACEFDWAFWKDSARSLVPDHATVARDVIMEFVVSGSEEALRGRLAEVRQAYDKPMSTLIAEIRRRAYSIRTEQAYEQWACRFILFFGNRDGLASALSSGKD